jgi:hypothetical protein
MALVAGLVFTAIAVLFLLDSADVVDARPGPMLALGAIGLGLSGVAGAVRAMIPARVRPERGAAEGPPADGAGS